MKKVNFIMMWLCVALGVLFVGFFIYSWVAMRLIDPAMIMFVVVAIVTAKVFWKRYRAPTQPKK